MLPAGGSAAATFTEAPVDEFTHQVPLEGLVSLRDCVGFLDHVRNARESRGMHEELPAAWFDRPAFYFANGASLHASDADISLPPSSEKFDFELEIGAILHSGGSNLTPAEASECIGGYVLYCDWSARDIQTEERSMQIGQGKGKDAAISLGPWVLSKDEADLHRTMDGFDFEVLVRINDEQYLSRPFTGMDWSFEELVAYASLGASVAAGDIIASGTIPGGCLLERAGDPDFPGWLREGDTVHLDGGPLGVISTRITASTASTASTKWRRPHHPLTQRISN